MQEMLVNAKVTHMVHYPVDTTISTSTALRHLGNLPDVAHTHAYKYLTKLFLKYEIHLPGLLSLQVVPLYQDDPVK